MNNSDTSNLEFEPLPPQTGLWNGMNDIKTVPTTNPEWWVDGVEIVMKPCLIPVKLHDNVVSTNPRDHVAECTMGFIQKQDETHASNSGDYDVGEHVYGKWHGSMWNPGKVCESVHL